MEKNRNEMSQWALHEQERYIPGFVDGERWPAFYKTRSTRADHKPGYVSSRAVSVPNTDKPQLENIRALLTGTRIDSKLYLDSKAGVPRSTITSWKLAILGRDNLLRSRDKIGFTDAGKAGTLTAMLDSYRKHGSESPRRSMW
jgi:hypothetical protein